jgi:cytoskeletal protein RodZ
MSFDDDFRMPDFDDEYGDEEPQDEDLEAEGGANRGFLIGVGLLSVVLVLALCLIGFILFRGQNQEPAVSETEMTNQANMTLFAETQTPQGDDTGEEGEAEPPEAPEETAPPTDEPAATADAIEDDPTTTPTSDLVVTDTPETDDETGEATATFTPIPEDDGQGGGDSGIPTPTPIATSEREIIEVTSLADAAATETAAAEQLTAVAADNATATANAAATQAAQPTEEAEGTEVVEATVVGEETAEPTGVGGPVEPTGDASEGTMEPGATATLPTTGFTGGTGLAGAGLLAVALVVVVIVVRRVRLN